MRQFVIVITLLLGCFGWTYAATPPALVNYQGVLRNASDAPLTGTYEMVFHFFSASTGGDEILVDTHTISGPSPVVVSGGLFNVQLGSGTITDGAGPGSYASLADVFRDYGTVYLSVQVAGETLTPRTRIVSAPYAENASNLEGKSAASFIDTSSAAQTKSGPLTVNAGTSGAIVGGSGYGVEAYGTVTGGYFGDSNSSGYGRIGFGDDGVVGFGAGRPGYFQNTASPTSEVALAESSYGVIAFADSFPGYFDTPTHNATAIVADGTTSRGIEAYGTNAGGYIADSNNTGYALIGYSDRGIEAHGNEMGGLFVDSNGTGVAAIGSGDLGVEAYGSSAGGYFADTNNTAHAYVGKLYSGIEAVGETGGRFFTTLDAGVSALLANNNRGIVATGSQSGGYFTVGNAPVRPWAEVGDHEGATFYKIFGNGSVSFVQNHPEDKHGVIVYAAPEGDEVAVYTRGSARLVNGEARVALGETFKWVANPDIGLTAQLTPVGSWADLYVVSKTTEEIVVRSRDPQATGVTFDYIVYGLRIGYEQASIVQEKKEYSALPPAEGIRIYYSEHPGFAEFNALERFKGMTSALGATAPLDLSRSNALAAAINTFDPEIDGPLVKRHEIPASLPPRPSAIAPGATSAGVPAGRPSTYPTSTQAPPPAVTTAGAAVRDCPIRLPMAHVTEPVDVGDVLVADRSVPGALCRSETAADSGAAGIAAADDSSTSDRHGSVSMALVGTLVPCKVDASTGPIHVGDLLTTSPNPGRAMRSPDGAAGTIVAKAMESLESGTGVIQVLVMVR